VDGKKKIEEKGKKARRLSVKWEIEETRPECYVQVMVRNSVLSSGGGRFFVGRARGVIPGGPAEWPTDQKI